MVIPSAEKETKKVCKKIPIKYVIIFHLIKKPYTLFCYWGRCFSLCFLFIPCFSSRSIARVILDVLTPRCRAISAALRPSSSRPRKAITARVWLTRCRRLPPFSSGMLTPLLLHSLAMISSMLLPARRSLSCRS